MTWCRPHAWCADRDALGETVRRCMRCGCLSTWPLAKMHCSGASIDDDDVPARRVGSDTRSARKSRAYRERKKRAHAVAAAGPCDRDEETSR